MAPSLLAWRNIDPTTSSAPVDVLLAEPALDTPPGVQRHMSTNSSEQKWFILGAVLCIVVPGFVLLLRIYTKIFIMRKSEIADLCIALGFPFLIVEAILGHYMVQNGAGAHQWNLTRAQLYELLYWGNVAEIVYFPAIFLVKMSILLQYLRLFAPNRSLNKTMYYGAWIIVVMSFVAYSSSMFWTIWYCSPRAMIWNKLTPGGHCHDHGPIVFSSSIFNVVSDICILLLPLLSIWRLRVPVGRKIAVSGLFATGLLACIASVMRIVFTIRIAPPIHISDVSYNSLWIGLWSEAEISLGYIVACTLSLPRLIRAKRFQLSRAFSPFHSKNNSQQTKSSGGTSRSQSRARDRVRQRVSNGSPDVAMVEVGERSVKGGARDVVVEIDAVVENDGVKGAEMSISTKEPQERRPQGGLGVLPDFEDDLEIGSYGGEMGRNRGLEVVKEVRESAETDELEEWRVQLERQQEIHALEMQRRELQRERDSLDMESGGRSRHYDPHPSGLPDPRLKATFYDDSP